MTDTRCAVIVEDEFLISYFLQDTSAEAGVHVAAMTSTAEDGLALIREHRPDFALIDVRLAGARDGVDLARQVVEEQPKLKVIFVTGSVEPETLERMRALSPAAILIKPIQSVDLVAALKGA